MRGRSGARSPVSVFPLRVAAACRCILPSRRLSPAAGFELPLVGARELCEVATGGSGEVETPSLAVVTAEGPEREFIRRSVWNDKYWANVSFADAVVTRLRLQCRETARKRVAEWGQFSK